MSRTDEPLIAIVGPTATGKTRLAMSIAARLGGEIVSVDSAQVFVGLDIGTAKPTKDERATVKHHLIDVISANEQWTAAAFADAADLAIASIRAAGRIPILCGGTGLWYRALVRGVFVSPPIAPEIRDRTREELTRLGAEALHGELNRVDPLSAKLLHPRDRQRVSRALEFFRQTGQSIAACQAEHGFHTTRYSAVAFSLSFDRARLSERIAERTRSMFRAGWVEEVEGLLQLGADPEGPGLSVIGYRQVVQLIKGGIKRSEAEEKTIIATRQYAKRQRNWFQSEPGVGVLPEGAGVDAFLEAWARTREGVSGSRTA